MDDKKNFDSAENNRRLTADELLEKLRKALSRQGDFPASAKIVSELRSLTSDPRVTANQITELILREPSLGVRVLHLVNSSFYRRAKPIMTVSQAVVQIGMRPLAEMCSGLVLLQKFVPAARRGGSFASCLKKLVVTSLLSSAIMPATSRSQGGGRNQEFGYLAGSFSELGTLLLAFYFPQIYEAALKRAESKKQEVGQSIKDITGLSPLQISMEVISSLELPPFYIEVLKAGEELLSGKVPATATETDRLARSVVASRAIAEMVANNKSRQDLEQAVSSAGNRYGLETQALATVLTELPKVFKRHCESLDLQLPDLPEYVGQIGTEPIKERVVEAKPVSQEEDQFIQFVSEIRQAVESREPTASVITSVMETCAFGLKFDRVLLLLVNAPKTKLVGRLLLGSAEGFDPKRFERNLVGQVDTSAPDIVLLLL